MSITLKMKNIRKQFPGVIALDGVNIELLKGSVLALLGENGAGKSTLMKILAGVCPQDEGVIEIFGKEVKIDNVNVAKTNGISIIFQELSLSDNLTIAENIYANKEPTKYGLIDDKKLNEECKNYLVSLGIEMDPKILVSNLSIAQKQLVEIAKGLVTNPKIIIMDEPTSALSNKETELLFNIINKLKNEGKSIIYISHRMEELFKIADFVTVLRDGKYINTVKISDTSVDELISMMVGRDMLEIYPKRDFNYQDNDVVLELKNLTKKDYYHNISLALKKGEILGMYGLMGSGRTEIVKGIFGILKKDSGEIFIENQKVEINSSKDAINCGIAFVTENRKEEGLVLTSSVAENISSVRIESIINKFGFLSYQKETNLANHYIKKLNIKTPNFEQIVNNLSGGNQQKVVLSKWFEIKPKILILDEPTRGIDVGAKFEIYKFINELSKSGVGIILISSELPEVLNMADKILVINDKKVITKLDADKTNQEEIMTYITNKKEVNLW